MERNGFTAKIVDVEDMAAVNTRYKVPEELQSCHTAIVDGYVIEGHVPVAEIKRLLRERPDVIGLAVPDMPDNAPGMGNEGADGQSYEVIAFDKFGKSEIFANYPK